MSDNGYTTALENPEKDPTNKVSDTTVKAELIFYNVVISFKDKMRSLAVHKKVAEIKEVGSFVTLTILSGDSFRYINYNVDLIDWIDIREEPKQNEGGD